MEKNIFKKIVLLFIVILGISIFVVSYAQNQCPKGKDCSDPGQCGLYTDSNNNGKCDYGKTDINAAKTQQTEQSDNPVKENNNTSTNNEASNNTSETDENSPSISATSGKSSNVLNSLLTPVAIVTLMMLIFSILLIGLKHRMKYRLVILIAGIAYLGFYIGGCLCPIGAFQNLPLRFSGLVNGQYLYWFVLFIIPVIFVLIAGRIYCGSVCPIGAVQEILFKLGTKLKLNKGNPGLENTQWLRYVKYVFMSALVIFTATTGINLFCQIDPFVVLFNFSGKLVATILLLVVLVLSLFISRPWCRIICPYGAFLGIIAKIGTLTNSKLTPKINKNTCKKCKLCTKHCPVDAIENESIDKSECINCGECTNRCKFNALT